MGSRARLGLSMSLFLFSTGVDVTPLILGGPPPVVGLFFDQS